MQIRPIFLGNPNIHQTSPYSIKNAFSEEELEWIENLQSLYPFVEATVGEGDDDQEMRKSKIKWIHHDDRSWWVYERMEKLINEANQQWGFTIASVIDSIQYTEYYDDGGHYDWHIDVGSYPLHNRKISITIQLSNPDDYEGGDLQFWINKQPDTAPREQGLAILFPSYLMHRVTPVTRGTRKSLVLWVGGIPFQ